MVPPANGPRQLSPSGWRGPTYGVNHGVAVPVAGVSETDAEGPGDSPGPSCGIAVIEPGGWGARRETYTQDAIAAASSASTRRFQSPLTARHDSSSTPRRQYPEMDSRSMPIPRSRRR